MQITQQDVEKVAQLARLAVSAAEQETFAKQLTQILAHVDTLRQYDTTGIEPTATVMGHVNAFREEFDLALTQIGIVEQGTAEARFTIDGEQVEIPSGYLHFDE